MDHAQHIVQLLSAKNRVDSALCDTSVKVGRHVLLFALIVLSYRAIAAFSCGCHGNRFKAKFTCFHKDTYNFNCIAPISLKLAPSERARISESGGLFGYNPS